ncbi:hypothetical protein [Salinibacterium sp. ZJ454]|uniref:hypothetical protein n=1 Tax=Salinibacterium sp. ZJ454 TaxID=2708339 RepID=UPI001421E251|nr:hypothetical protein [Salinibacterium sp. ZJ454]
MTETTHPDELTVQVGYRVSTEQQAVQAALLRELEAEIAAFVGRLSLVDRGATFLTPFQAGPALLTLRADGAIEEARARLLLALAGARSAGSALSAAALAYDEAERRAHELARGLGSLLGYGMGLFGPLALIWILSPLIAAVTGIGVAAALHPHGAELLQAGAAAWWAEHRDILSDPLTVELLRAAIMGSDDVLGGALHLPPALVLLLGDQGLGVTGVSTTAALVVALANGAGTLKEAPVTVTRTATSAVTAPTGLRDRLARVPHGVPHQVRVERYPMPGKADRVEVFIGGTVDGSLFTGEQPWDMTSNAHGVAALHPASLRAVREALADAGVAAGDRIGITGYSQGALVGALIAASGDYDVGFLLEAGGPSGQVAVPESVTHVRLDHTADLVTALGGDVRGEHTVQVRRDGVPADTGLALPAHQYAFYLQTAEFADRSPHPEIRSVIEAADAPLHGAGRGVAGDWLAVRQVSGARE